MNIVWFNGPSQNQLIDRIPIQHQEIGCNHIHRRRPVHHVVCYDWQMLDLIPPGAYTRWCRSGIYHPHYRQVPYTLRQQPHNSGVLALLLALHLGWDHCYLLGCDWGISNDSVFDYGHRNSELKYTNSQRRVIHSIHPVCPITVVNDNAIDLELDRISIDTFCDLVSQ